MKRRVLILGSTGSIGEQALDVIGRSGELEVVGLAAARNGERLCEQARAGRVDAVALIDVEAAERLARELDGCRVLGGEAGVRDLIGITEPDLVLNAIVGTAGLAPTIVALTEGIDVALANKESLVVGGDLVTALAEATDSRIIPVDSEHSALHQLVAAERPGTVDRLVLTASGGPFRGRTDLEGITPDDALAHPTWDMGGRITIDSATLMNKGFEVIEAHHLFGIPYERIEVVVHPQSIVHALVDLNDGASLAHLGHPDMRVPISYALHLGEREDVPVARLDLAAVGELTFEDPDVKTFPCLQLAREAGAAGGTAPCTLNAADEVAVAAFLDGAIPFATIPELIERALDAVPPATPTHFDDLFEVDRRAREVVEGLVRTGAGARGPGPRDAGTAAGPPRSP